MPGLYEMSISADELFSHDYVEFYVCAENQYHRNLTETYKVDIHKLSTVDGVRTNITDGEEVGGKVTITANSAALTVSVNGNLEGRRLPAASWSRSPLTRSPPRPPRPPSPTSPTQLPLELDFTNGTVVKLGQKFGMPTPANAVVLRAVHAVERSMAQAGLDLLRTVKNAL